MTTRQDIPYLDRLEDELMRSIEARRPAPSRAPRRMVLAAGAAVAVVAAGVTAATVLGGGDTPSPVPTSPEPAVTTGGLIGMCIQGGTAEAIGEREYGLSGTIVDVTAPADEAAPTEVTVEVDHWYRTGDFGDASTVVLRTSTRPGAEGMSLAGGGEVPLETGTRILATGDDDFLWDCGDFSRPWSEDGAALFEEAFGA